MNSKTNLNKWLLSNEESGFKALKISELQKP